MKAMPLTHSLSASHFWHDGTSIQLSGLIMFHACAPALTAALSRFTPPLIRLCFINNDRQKAAVHTGGPSCRGAASAAVQHLTPISSTVLTNRGVLFPRCQQGATQSGGLPFTLTDAQYSTMAPVLNIRTASQKRDHSTMVTL